MSWLKPLLSTPFGLAVVGLVLLSGWSLWTAGVADNDLQHAARSGSVFADAGVELDTEAAAEVIGNRRLFVAFLRPGADLGAACEELEGPAEGTQALLPSRAGADAEDYDSCGCSQLPGADDENLGKAYVAEAVIIRGIDAFVDRPSRHSRSSPSTTTGWLKPASCRTTRGRSVRPCRGTWSRSRPSSPSWLAPHSPTPARAVRASSPRSAARTAMRPTMRVRH